MKVNGKKVKPELIGDCMMSLPINAGENTIEMKYHVQGLYAGIAMSVVGAAFWGITVWYERKRR